MTALFIFPASLLRPLGGWLSDKYGARRMTAISFGGHRPGVRGPLLLDERRPFTIMVLFVGVAMGIGKASVYTYIPQYFPKDVGAVGGLVGAVGGLGGFVLPLLFAWAKVQTGRPESTFYVLLGLAFISMFSCQSQSRAPCRRSPRRDVIKWIPPPPTKQPEARPG